MKGIIFSTHMVQAIRAGRKTQTRRVMKVQPKDNQYPIEYDETWGFVQKKILETSPNKYEVIQHFKPPYKVGDVLYVKETYSHTEQLNIHPTDENYGYVYKADNQPWEDFEGWKWKSPMFMPEKAARLFIVITGVKVERLQDIREEDAIKEGIERCIADRDRFGVRAAGMRLYRNYERKDNSLRDYPCNGFDSAKISYETLWESIHGKESWNANPWVWAYTFEIYQP